MRMSSNRQRFIARLICVPTAAVTALTVGLLIASYVQAWRRAPLDIAQLEMLELGSNEDLLQIEVLNVERDRQREASLDREALTNLLAGALVAAAALFLGSFKWLNVLKGRRPPDLDTVLAANGNPARAKARGSADDHDLSLPVLTPGPAGEGALPDLEFIGEIIERHGRGREAVIPILQGIQSRERFLHEDALRYVCDKTSITPAQIIGVSSFYLQFRRSPVGKHLIKVCHGTACHVAGARTVSDEIRRTLGISPGTDTDPARQFTIEEVACLGCCTLAPVAQIDDVTYGHLRPDSVHRMLHDFLEADGSGTSKIPSAATVRQEEAVTPLGEIRIGLGSCCVAGGSGKVYDALEEAIASTGARVKIKRVGCVGMCHQTPLIEAVVPGEPSSLYTGVGPADALSIVRNHFPARGLGKRMANTASRWIEDIRQNGRQESITRRPKDVRDPPIAAFLGPQKHIATEHFGRLDPTNLDEYLEHDGFKALKRAVCELTADQVIESIVESGLRGRGGAGFPTGIKWSRVRRAAADRRDNQDAAAQGTNAPYVVCNGDEGDPGAFMDRMLMESFPYRVIEGMAIAARAVGASEGYFYIRAEYPLAVSRIRDALRKCEERGLLGDDILGTQSCGREPSDPLTLRLKIMEGAGAFVCGEETALLASIEGDRGSPRLRPPFPADRGLWGRPTLVNNVETYATVPWILRHAAEAFAALGTPTCNGTKVFSLAGKVARGGLIEVPMGITIREIVHEIGGGIKKGRQFKAVQIGGPSGGCVPAALADTPVDYEALIGVGAIMGSGGLVVLDDSDCMVDIARYFLTFTQKQSCGKCSYCRVGTRRMLDILDRLCTGGGRKGDLDALEQLSSAVVRGSLCGLGKTAPNPVRSTLRYFRSEYEAHLEGRCPAGKCKELITYRVTDECVGCTLCAQQCPVEAIPYTPYRKHEIDADTCTRCDICRTNCPENAIEVV